MKRIMIQLPPDLVFTIDKEAEKWGMSRSGIILFIIKQQFSLTGEK